MKILTVGAGIGGSSAAFSFGLLVSGLNGRIPHRRELSLLRAALTRLFLLEDAA